LGGWEVILITTIILILMGVKELGDFRNGLGEGMKKFRKATRQVADDIEEALEQRISQKKEDASHPFLMALAVILGILCLILVLYEIVK
jgi:sec-independent protein translocase protein TatA